MMPWLAEVQILMKASKNSNSGSSLTGRRISRSLQFLLIVSLVPMVPATIYYANSAESRNVDSGAVVRAEDNRVIAQKTDKSDKAEKDKADKEKDKDKSEKDKTDKSAEKPAAPKPEPVIENVVSVAPEDLVAKPHEFMGKNVKFTASFSGFNNLALDYKPAFRSSKTHLSFLVHKTKTHLPLPELKLAMMIPKEKDPETTLLATLKDGEGIEIIGKVFAAALDDPWVEVLKIRKLIPDKDDKKADAGDGKTKTSEKSSGESKPDKSTGGKPDGDSKEKGKTPSKN